MTTPAVAVDLVLSDANTLFGWMGRFWSQVYQDPDFVRLCMTGRGMNATSLVITGEETRKLVDRRSLPVLHRERWFPVTIRESQRGIGGAGTLRIGAQPTPVLGPQNPGVFRSGRVFQIGGSVQFDDIIVYPIDTGVVHVMSLITDNPAAPRMTLTPADFAVESGSLVLRRSMDPFADSTLAPNVELGPDGSVKDRTLTLWGLDVMFDWQYVAKYLGYVLGFNSAPSTEYHKRLINAMWDSLTGAATLANTEALATAIYDVPVAVVDEPVVRILSGLVLTATHAYKVTTVDPAITEGTVLYRGQPLTTGVKLVTGAYNTDALGSQLRIDVPSVTFPVSFFAAPLNSGLTADWNEVPVVVDGFDANGNPRVRFAFNGDPDDDQAFWELFWSNCEAAGVSSRACMADWIDDIVVATDGAVLGYIAPLEFMLRTFVGVNCAFLVVDRSALSADGLDAVRKGYAGLIQDTIPAGQYLFLIERKTVPVEQYELDDTTDAVQMYLGRAVRSVAGEGSASKVRGTYKDLGVRCRWVAVCNER